MNKVKDLCKNIELEQITIYRKEKRIDIWISHYEFRDFVKELKYCLGLDIFYEGGIKASILDDTIYIGHFEDILEQYELDAYRMFINCMKNKTYINYYK